MKTFEYSNLKNYLNDLESALHQAKLDMTRRCIEVSFSGKDIACNSQWNLFGQDVGDFVREELKPTLATTLNTISQSYTKLSALYRDMQGYDKNNTQLTFDFV